MQSKAQQVKYLVKIQSLTANNSIRSICIGLWCESNCQFLFILDTYLEGKVNEICNSKYLLCINLKFSNRASWDHILQASFKNLDSVRFGAMFGSFALLWKSVNNGMRLYRGKDDRLNGLVGGAVAGLSILFEKKERRVDIAQQMLVR